MVVAGGGLKTASLSALTCLCRRLCHSISQSAHPPPVLTPSPVNPFHLRRVCTVLYQQQNSTEARLHAKLSACDFSLTHEFFLQICNTFPYSWRPVFLFFQYTKTIPDFVHTSVSFNKMVDVVGKARNVELFWELLQEVARRGLVNDKTFRIALETFAEARELKKCVEVFHLMNNYGFHYNLNTLNRSIETLCRCKLVEEAMFVVMKLKEWIKPDGLTYAFLIKGFCVVGNLIEASKIWNLMVEEGFEPDVATIEVMMETLFKTKQYSEALNLFQTMRSNRMDDLALSTYKLAIKWLCQVGKVKQAHYLFEEMTKRGIQPDNLTMASIIYGLLTRGRVREAYNMVMEIEKPDISVFHGLIKGLLRLRRASEATEVFREMINRGCEPNMHTYIMLLQGHLGRRGRNGLNPLVNFDTIFVGGLVKAGKSLEATKFVERMMEGGLDVPKFDYNKFLHYFSNEDGVIMFEEVGKKLRKVGLIDLADIFQRYGQRMATRGGRRIKETQAFVECCIRSPKTASHQRHSKSSCGLLVTLLHLMDQNMG